MNLEQEIRKLVGTNFVSYTRKPWAIEVQVLTPADPVYGVCEDIQHFLARGEYLTGDKLDEWLLRAFTIEWKNWLKTIEETHRRHREMLGDAQGEEEGGIR